MKVQHSKHDLFVLGPPSTCPVFIAGGRYSCDEHHMYPSLWIVTNTCVFGIAAVVALPHIFGSKRNPPPADCFCGTRAALMSMMSV
jgi:hypothetical protein